MKFLDEFRDAAMARRYAEAIAGVCTRPWVIMEVCGGQTHSIVRHGIDHMLPPGVTLLHGPGCPVCVTPSATVDAAIALAGRPGVVFCSFGDMLRVPGSAGSLLAARSRGADVRMVYSPLDALALARQNPEREVVFFAVGFETTAPTTALAVLQAEREELANFSVLVSHVLVPPAIEALLADPDNRVQAFLAAGHACTISGYRDYEPIAERFGIPIVVTGFEPVDLLQGLYLCIAQLERGEARVENQYSRMVRRDGNTGARQAMERVFAVQDQPWRGMGELPSSGLGLAERYRRFDARRRFGLARPLPESPGECISGDVLRGLKKPPQCPAFGGRCTPQHPLGATMVSSEGACAAYYRFRPPETDVQAAPTRGVADDE